MTSPISIESAQDISSNAHQIVLRWYNRRAARKFPTPEEMKKSKNSDRGIEAPKALVHAGIGGTLLHAELKLEHRSITGYSSVKIGAQVQFHEKINIPTDAARDYFRASLLPWLVIQAWNAMESDLRDLGVSFGRAPLPDEMLWDGKIDLQVSESDENDQSVIEFNPIGSFH